VFAPVWVETGKERALVFLRLNKRLKRLKAVVKVKPENNSELNRIQTHDFCGTCEVYVVEIQVNT